MDDDDDNVPAGYSDPYCELSDNEPLLPEEDED